MWIEAALIAGFAFLCSVLLTRVVRKAALSRRLLDIPNERSSHRNPTPRSGGLAIVVATTAVTSALTFMGALDSKVFFALTGGGLAVAASGLVDDYRSVAPATRLVVHVIAACWALAWLGGFPPLRLGEHVVDLGWVGQVLGVLGIVWTLNLFNFMDGIDGIAAAEAMFVSWSGALLMVLVGSAAGLTMASVAFGAACSGFLVWNWPPARIFMGDVGSGYIGYVLAILAMAVARSNDVALYVWLILGGVFLVDATVTLLRRLLRRRRVYEAHRSHAYQRLARQWASHKRVTIVATVVNVVWLLPCALATIAHPRYAGWIALAALAPLVVAALTVGAGKDEVDAGK